MGSDRKITAENVISKLKDDGDFDRLRLKIIRQLKQDEDLRNNIISAVKQSAALNQDGAENMKPRELCDAIHDEVRERVMSQISDGIWGIIRTENGMKTEITETVQSVYNQLVEHQGQPNSEPPSMDQLPSTSRTTVNGTRVVSGEANGTLSYGDVNEPPGFSVQNHISSNHHETHPETDQAGKSGRKSQEQVTEPHPHRSNGSLEVEEGNPIQPTGFVSLGKRKKPLDSIDEDPDIPPGFG